ncbi:putative protein T-ENOL isoform X4 [Erinaceus europaeus]|uniref:Uncharacterized protein n=1 Tax=Erinaceus europaeus TaxID=9365 RepID=A0ABM3VXK0_ERIEU|nr:putative protein T-ENOL isoform X4 [Erinaceus europaeus]
MASSATRTEQLKGNQPPQAAPSLGPKATLSRSEEFLTRISTELTNEALFIAGYHLNPVSPKEKQTQDRGTQISRHAATETGPAPRHTSCHPLVRRELCLAI